MAQNRNTLIRFKTIDKCLQDRKSRWSLDDLIAACSKALSELEGREVVISKRSVQLDIQMMRSSEMGYSAPIEVYERKFYRYTDDDFSITKLAMTDHDKRLIVESLDTIAQYNGFDFYNAFQKSIEHLKDLTNLAEFPSEMPQTDKIIIELDKSKKDKVLKKPLHKSQKIKEEKKNGNLVLQYKLSNTDKFLKKLKQLKDVVKVVSPKHIKKEFKESLGVK